MFTLFGSTILFAIICILAVIFMLIGDRKGSWEGIIATLVIFLGLNFFWGNFPVLEYITFRNVAMYLFIGFLFSLIRTYFKGQYFKRKYEGKPTATDLAKEDFELKDHIFRWWFFFPISALTWFFGDFYEYVYSKLEKLYLYLFNR